ncbi:hypothetical protein Tco_0918267 [Tanacetum coccineum]
MIKVVSRHEDTRLYGAILPNELMNKDIRNSKSYKEYYVITSGVEPTKTKASVKKKQVGYDKTKTPPTTKGKRVKTSAKAAKPAKKKQPAKTSKDKGLTVLSKVALTKAEQIKLATKRSLIETHSSHARGSGADEGTSSIPGVPDVPTYGSDDEQISWKSSDEEDDDEVTLNDDNDDDDGNDDDGNNDDDDDDVDNQDDDDEQTDSDNDGDDFVHPKFSTHDEEHKEEDSFDPRVQTPFHIESNKMNEAVKTAIQLQSDKLRNEAQADNEDFINKLDANIKKIIKEQVKEQVKAQVSKILPKNEKTVNEQLEAEVLTRLSNESKTSHVVAANLSKLELKKIIIDKMESNKSIHRSYEQKNLYKALVDAYESDKLKLDTYGDTISFKRRRDNEDKDEEPSAGSNRGSKRRRAGKEPESTSLPKEKTSKTIRMSTEGYKSEDKDEEPSAGSNRGSKRRRARKELESTSAPKEKTSMTTGKSTEGSKSHHKSAGESAQVEEPMHTSKDLEEPAHQEFETGVTED